MNKNITKKQGLLSASQRKKDTTLTRGLEALAQMQQEKIPINFQSLARFAKVSKVWLYKQPELCEQIKQLRSQSDIIKRSRDTQIALKNKDLEIKKLMLKLKQKDEKIRQLKKQLEIVYGELLKKNKAH